MCRLDSARLATRAPAEWLRPVTVAMVVAFLLGRDALAQEAAQALDEVVVTAQRRAENLQKVPIAASAFSSADLQERGVRALEDLEFQSPALSVQEQGFLKFVNIRGVGLQAVNPSTSSGVAFYSDGFFIPHETAIGEAYLDLERVEILRGPQGTLVGQNSTGGAIYTVTRKPQFDKVTGSLQQTAGNYGWYRTEAAVNAPLNDTLAVRTAASLETRGTFYTILPMPGTNLYTNPSQPGNVHAHSVRLQALYQPNERFQLNLKQEIEERTSDGTPSKSFTELANPTTPALANPFTLQYNVPTKNDYSLRRTTLEANWQLTDSVKLRSMTGYQHEDSRLAYDLDFSAVDTAVGFHHFYEDTFEQELNLISTGQGPLSWVVGAFYLRDRLPVQLDFQFHPAPEVIQDTAPVHTSYSAFGQVTYDLTSHWQVLVGGRVTHDVTQGSGFVEVVPFSTSSLDIRTTSTQPTGKVALNWLISNDTMVYASVSKGYKAGGLNAATPGENFTFNPEKIVAYEGGWKSTFADRHLRASGAVFYYDYTDFQLAVFNPATGDNPIKNAGTASLYGGELELTTRFGGFSANLSAGYTHSRIDHLALLDPRSPGLGTQILDGRTSNYAPRWTASAGVEYAFSLGAGTLTPRVQYAYTATQYASVFQLAPFDIIPSHGVVDAKLTYHSGGNWWVEGFGTNLANKLYIAGIQFGNSAYWGAPRQGGIRAGVDF